MLSFKQLVTKTDKPRLPTTASFKFLLFVCSLRFPLQRAHRIGSVPRYLWPPLPEMFYAFYPVGPDATMMSALLGHVHAPHGMSFTHEVPASQPGPRLERAPRRRLSEVFRRRSSKPSPSESSINAEASPESKSFTKGIFGRQSSAVSTKTVSTTASSKSAKSLKSTSNSGNSPSTSRNDAHMSAWSYVVW